MPSRRLLDTDEPPARLADDRLAGDDHVSESAAVSGMFGRDMIYLAFWALQIVLAAALTPATTRLMPKTAFGQAAAGIAVMQLLNCICGFGLYTAVQRAYAPI